MTKRWLDVSELVISLVISELHDLFRFFFSLFDWKNQSTSKGVI